MKQSLFFVDGTSGNLHVRITRIEGNLLTRSGQGQQLVIEAEGPVAELRQEGSLVIITDSKGTIELWMPTTRSFSTDISVTELSGDVTIEGVEQVTLEDVGGDVMLKDISGNTRLEHIQGTARLANMGGDVHGVSLPALFTRGGIAGDATLSHVTQVEIDFVGGDVTLDSVSTAEIIAISGDLMAREVEIALHCTTVGGDCRVVDSPGAEIGISNVANDFQMGGMAPGRMSNIGGNLDLHATFPTAQTSRFHVEGDATVTLAADSSLILHVLVGGEVSGEALGSYGGGNSFHLLYGDGEAALYLNIGGDLILCGPIVPYP